MERTIRASLQRAKLALAPGRLTAKVGTHTAAGTTKEVAFAPVEGPINDRLDEAYRAKYRESPYLAPMVAERARSATIKITPRG